MRIEDLVELHSKLGELIVAQRQVFDTQLIVADLKRLRVRITALINANKHVRTFEAHGPWATRAARRRDELLNEVRSLATRVLG